jgi:hypothetical protein
MSIARRDQSRRTTGGAATPYSSPENRPSKLMSPPRSTTASARRAAARLLEPASSASAMHSGDSASTPRYGDTHDRNALHERQDGGGGQGVRVFGCAGQKVWAVQNVADEPLGDGERDRGCQEKQSNEDCDFPGGCRGRFALLHSGWSAHRRHGEPPGVFASGGPLRPNPTGTGGVSPSPPNSPHRGKRASTAAALPQAFRFPFPSTRELAFSLATPARTSVQGSRRPREPSTELSPRCRACC